MAHGVPRLVHLGRAGPDGRCPGANNAVRRQAQSPFAAVACKLAKAIARAGGATVLSFGTQPAIRTLLPETWALLVRAPTSGSCVFFGEAVYEKVA
jgi:hypothetical protein